MAEKIERIGVSLEKALLHDFDGLIDRKGYGNRSEAIRDLIRNYLSQQKLSEPTAEAIAAVLLIYDHHVARLSEKLVQLQHDSLLQVVASVHVHISHHDCLEVIILKGNVGKIDKLADSMTSLKGVKLGRLNVMPMPAGGRK